MLTPCKNYSGCTVRVGLAAETVRSRHSACIDTVSPVVIDHDTALLLMLLLLLLLWRHVLALLAS